MLAWLGHDCGLSFCYCGTEIEEDMDWEGIAERDKVCTDFFGADWEYACAYEQGWTLEAVEGVSEKNEFEN